MTTNQDLSRKAFEAAVINRRPHDKNHHLERSADGQCYESANTELRWEGWQLALSAQPAPVAAEPVVLEDGWVDKFTSPLPQSGDAADEAKLEELMDRFALDAIDIGDVSKQVDWGHRYYVTREALRSFFKRAAKGGEGMVSLSLDDLHWLVGCMNGPINEVCTDEAKARWARVQSAVATKHP